MVVDYLPQTAGVRVEWGPLKESYCGSIAQSAVDINGMAGNPAQVCRAKEYVISVVVEDVFEGSCSVNHVATGGMDYSFWFASGATGLLD